MDKIHSARKAVTRAEACAALAYKLGWTRNGNVDTVAYEMWKDPAGRLHNEPPDYFTDLRAARELVAWLATPESGVDRTAFGQGLAVLADIDPDDKFAFKIIHSLLATPEQITLAACRALGIEIE